MRELEAYVIFERSQQLPVNCILVVRLIGDRSLVRSSGLLVAVGEPTHTIHHKHQNHLLSRQPILQASLISPLYAIKLRHTYLSLNRGRGSSMGTEDETDLSLQNRAIAAAGAALVAACIVNPLDVIKVGTCQQLQVLVMMLLSASLCGGGAVAAAGPSPCMWRHSLDQLQHVPSLTFEYKPTMVHFVLCCCCHVVACRPASKHKPWLRQQVASGHAAHR